MQDGGRALIASQTNLAVDNALQRLAGDPRVRPLRIGKPERVEEEFRGLLQDAAVGHWFTAIRQNCEQRLEQHAAAQRRIQAAGESLAHLHNVLTEAAELETRLADDERQLADLRAQHAAHRQSFIDARHAADGLARQARTLRDLARWIEDSNVDPPPEELLADATVAGVLSETVRQLQSVVPDARWRVPWLHGMN